MSKEPAEQIYAKPDTYDLEHAGPEPDVDFFLNLAGSFRPKRMLEIACGNGRLTIPLAETAREWSGEVHGLEIAREMLDSAKSKPGADLVSWMEGDIRNWRPPHQYNLALSPCASLSHLLSIEDQLAAWRTVFEALEPGGRFVVAETMANLPVLAESMQVPPRVSLEIDGDTTDEATKRRLIRYRTTRYYADQQQAKVHFIYDQFHQQEPENPNRFLSDYESHVYFPRELQLLFIATGFVVEDSWGSYRRKPLSHTSRQMIICGRKPGIGEPS